MKTYYCGGYYLVKPFTGSCSTTSRKSPQKIYTISDCICDIFPDIWTLSWVNRKDAKRERFMKEFQLTDSDLDALHIYMDSLHNQELFGWPNVLCNIETARHVYYSYLRNIDNIKLLAIGLPAQYMEEAIENLRPVGSQGSSGTFLNLSQRNLLDCSNAMGFDVLGIDCPGSFHTHLCHGINYEICDGYAITSNLNGFINTFAEADKLANILNDPESGAEPALWLPWVVVEFPLYD